MLVSSNYDTVDTLVKASLPITFQRFRGAHTHKIVKTLYHIMCLWRNLDNNFKVTPISVGNMDVFIFFAIVRGADAENNESKLHKWKEVKLSFLSRYMYFLSLYGNKKSGIQDTSKICNYLLDFIH